MFCAVSAVVTLLSGACVRIEVEGVVRACLHACLTANADIAVEIHDGVRPLVESVDGANVYTRSGVTVVAAEHGEVAPNFWECPLLYIFDPCSEFAEGNFIFRFARYCAGVTTDASTLVDDKSKTCHVLIYRGPTGRLRRDFSLRKDRDLPRLIAGVTPQLLR